MKNKGEKVSMENELNLKIREIYSNFIKELEVKAPQLLGEEYSNIFCTGILDEWEQARNKVMIIGEEAAWGRRTKYDDEIKSCQEWILNFLNDQVKETKFGFDKNNYPFWKRFRLIVEQLPKNSAFCYANIDCINNPNTNNGALTSKERAALHSTDIKILQEVVNLIKPTIVIFFGWHNKSLKHEFNSLYNKVYPEKEGNTSHFIKNGVLGCYQESNRIYILSYHPSYPIARTKQYKNNNEYDNAIVELIKKYIS